MVACVGVDVPAGVVAAIALAEWLEGDDGEGKVDVGESKPGEPMV